MPAFGQRLRDVLHPSCAYRARTFPRLSAMHRAAATLPFNAFCYMSSYYMQFFSFVNPVFPLLSLSGGACRMYFLSRATKSTKKCPSCDLCRANGGRGRLKSRGTPAVESIHSQRPVPGASISLREDDAGPCGLRRCEAIKVCCPGTQRSWDGGRCRRPSRAIHLPERV